MQKCLYPNKSYERITLDDGYTALVQRSRAEGGSLTLTQWENALKQPLKLIQNPEKVFRDTEKIKVVVKDLQGLDNKKAVIKFEPSTRGWQEIFRSLAGAKSYRNLVKACTLSSRQIKVLLPLAVLWQRKGLLITNSIYITEYAPGSMDLREFISSGRWAVLKSERKKLLTEKIAWLMVSLFRAGFSHRDAKAANFLVTADDRQKLEVLLLDPDGVRSFGDVGTEMQIKALGKLTATLMDYQDVSASDHMRVVKKFCQYMGYFRRDRKNFFQSVRKQAFAERTAIIAKSAASQSGAA